MSAKLWALSVCRPLIFESRLSSVLSSPSIFSPMLFSSPSNFSSRAWLPVSNSEIFWLEIPFWFSMSWIWFLIWFRSFELCSTIFCSCSFTWTWILLARTVTSFIFSTVSTCLPSKIATVLCNPSMVSSICLIWSSLCFNLSLISPRLLFWLPVICLREAISFTLSWTWLDVSSRFLTRLAWWASRSSSLSEFLLISGCAFLTVSSKVFSSDSTLSILCLSTWRYFKKSSDFDSRPRIWLLKVALVEMKVLMFSVCSLRRLEWLAMSWAFLWILSSASLSFWLADSSYPLSLASISRIKFFVASGPAFSSDSILPSLETVASWTMLSLSRRAELSLVCSCFKVISIFVIASSTSALRSAMALALVDTVASMSSLALASACCLSASTFFTVSVWM